MIYDEGFGAADRSRVPQRRQRVSPDPAPCLAEVHIDGRIFFAFSKYVPKTPESLAKVPGACSDGGGGVAADHSLSLSRRARACCVLPWQDDVEDYISICEETLVGWFHNDDLSHWGCYHGAYPSTHPG
jgi:hypothetical protein